MRYSRYVQICFVILVVMANAAFAFGQENEDDAILKLFSDEETVVATSPIPRPISKIAENVTVITADDIARLNAHTLAEVLQTVPGVQLDFNLRTPTTFSFFSVQGALNSTVLVLIDGIRQNDFDQNMVSPGLVPVQQIERIEIIKGAASGAWGSALGGVINIVTKSPNPERLLSGVASASLGSRFTADSIGEVSGTKSRFGYYLTAGHLRSDGLSPNTSTRADNLYGKLSYALPGSGTLTAGASHLAARPGLDEGELPPYGVVHDNNENRRSYGFLKLQQPIGDKLGLDVLGYLTDRDDHSKFGGRDPLGVVTYTNDFAVRDATRGVNASLTLGDREDNLVLGGEYVHAHASSRDDLNPDPALYRRSWDRAAWYGNGSLTMGNLSVLPGIRYDKTGLAGDHMSYTLGLTYQLGEKTTLRAYAARGFSLPILAVETGVQKVRTVQGGIETGLVPYLWLKGTYFFNALRNAESLGTVVAVSDQDRQGFELEAKTAPVFGLALATGYTYLYARDIATGQRLETNGQQTVPPHLVKLALNYDRDACGVHGSLTGSYVAWGATSGYAAKSAGMIWDLHLTWQLGPQGALAPELFFTGHNLFDGVQSTNTILYSNASRWFEGGARVRF